MLELGKFRGPEMMVVVIIRINAEDDDDGEDGEDESRVDR